jgi:sulfonate transport system substrate-binding protein
MKIRPLSFGFFLALAGLALAGWLYSRAAPSGAVLLVASQKGGTKAVMMASHALDGAPYKVEWSEFAAAAPLLEALGANAVDVGLAGDAPFFFAYANGAKIHAVQAGKASSDGAEVAILVGPNSPLHSAADLRGKRIATGRGSIGHYLLLRVLEQAGIPVSDVTVVFLGPADAKAAFASGAVDAWSTWAVYIPLVTQRGQGRVLVDGHGLLSGYGFSAASDAAISGKRAILADFLRRQTVAYRWALAHPAQFSQAFAHETGVDPDIADTFVRLDSFVPVPIDAAMVAEEQDVLRRFVAADAIGKLPDVPAALDASFDGEALRPVN